MADLRGVWEPQTLKEARDPEFYIYLLLGGMCSPVEVILPVRIPLHVFCKALSDLARKILPRFLEAYKAGISFPILQMRKQAQGSDLLLLEALSLVCGRAETQTRVS